ncbi:anaerobic ribonucleoside-triphosphate reductase [Varibaculum cambriense]|uniref:anaerobic ribonucleoside-triphosphate reductase n=1 Tax=Varibaculum cambriense TaxID=184870 RepID=UPI00241EC46C|nr:anaerobic ribonucleoside-triphosphate reductase [Varibaculum cambriense]MBS5944816.1 anaerobic ribonucleoside-triphosphate reductase [Varibaculum cambriense]MDU5315541.1 anaerobic ribonucleoside-triphosphate reductase [Varibaculum cambriense]MDU5615491.1 anaerobic ribonucleoside-triphosphate reductase [Varibaculum cambriense]MDU6681878.1 anaerobic ribonucleoside-triphosphate reductase [Varibaculum cambriense]
MLRETSTSSATVVAKRDGRTVSFDAGKIYRAVVLAMNSQGIEDRDFAEEITQTVVANLDPSSLDVPTIQTAVEDVLMVSRYPEVARAYIEYRHDRDTAREQEMDVSRSLDKLMARDATVVNENANKDSTVFNTQRDLTSGAVAKAYALKNLLPEAVANAHLKGDIHFHDLDYNPFQPMTNCCLIDIEGMLREGFQIGNARVESPRSINTATAQIAQIIANVASSQYGGCSVDRTDEVLAPYARLNYAKHMKDAEEWVAEDRREEYAWTKTRKDIYDAMQSLEYEINTLYSSNGQTPFVTLGFGMGTDRFEREIQKSILKIRIEGVGKDKHTAIFPKLVFGLRRETNLNPEDPNYDIKQLALECSTKRMYPDVLSYDRLTEIEGDYKVPMGCRSFLPKWVDPQTGEAVNAGRNNLGVVTLNIPRIAMQSRGSKERFWKIFDERMQVVKEALVYRARRCEDATPENAPILYRYGAFGIRAEEGDQDVTKFFHNQRSTLSIGYIGLYEAATVFYGPDWETDTEAKDFTIEIVKRMAELADQWKKEYPYWFSVYSTPSESLTDRFCRLDRQKFGNIPDITAKEYYTNSFHYDVRKKITPFEKIDFEAIYPEYAKGGFIHYCEYPKLTHNTKALEAVWDYAYDKVAYLGTNTPIDKCYECGFSGEFAPTAEGFKCPECGNTDPDTCDVVKRTCGYLGNPQKRPMVHGRHEEIINRVKHMDGPAA